MRKRSPQDYLEPGELASSHLHHGAGAESVASGTDQAAEDVSFGLLDPEVTLYVTVGAESQRAFTILDAAEIIIDVVAARERRRPVAEWGGETFTGIEEIMTLAEVFHALDADLAQRLQRGDDPLFQRRDQARGDRVNALWERKRDEVRRYAEQVIASLNA